MSPRLLQATKKNATRVRARRLLLDRLRCLVLRRRAVQFPNCSKEIRSIDCSRNDKGRRNGTVNPVPTRTVDLHGLM